MLADAANGDDKAPYLDRLAEGAVELEMAGDRGTWWTTLVAERIDELAALQTRNAE